MSVKELSKKNEYYISKERHLELIHFCRQYDEWIRELRDMNLTARASDNEVKSTDIQDQTYDKAVRSARLSRRIDIIKDTAYEVTRGYRIESYLDISKLLIMAVTDPKGISYYDLSYKKGVRYNDLTNDIIFMSDLISEYEYRKLYRKFFWLLDKVRD